MSPTQRKHNIPIHTRNEITTNELNRGASPIAGSSSSSPENRVPQGVTIVTKKKNTYTSFIASHLSITSDSFLLLLLLTFEARAVCCFGYSFFSLHSIVYFQLKFTIIANRTSKKKSTIGFQAKHFWMRKKSRRRSNRIKCIGICLSVDVGDEVKPKMPLTIERHRQESCCCLLLLLYNMRHRHTSYVCVCIDWELLI